MRGIKEYYKYLNNPNRVVKNMFSEADSLIARRPVGSSMKALPPGPRAMPSGTPDPSGIKVTTGNPFNVAPKKEVVQEPTVKFTWNTEWPKKYGNPRVKTTSKALLGRPVYLNDKNGKW